MSHATEKVFVVNDLDTIGNQMNYQPAFSPRLWRRLMTVLSKGLSRPINKEDGVK